MQLITSAQNPRYRQVLKLQASRGRKLQDRVIIFGEREVTRAVASQWPIVELWFCQESRHQPPLQTLVATMTAAGQQQVNLFEVPQALFERLEFGERHDGVIAISRRPETSLEQFSPRPPQSVSQTENSLLLVLEGVEKPGNLGAVLRSADGAGVHGVIIANPHTDFFHPNVIRASIGAVMHLPLAAGNTLQVIQWLSEQRYQIMLASLAGSIPYSQANLAGRCAIVLGTEAKGLSTAWYTAPHQAIRLPMLGIADSLNVSVAAAVMAYEARRQRD